MRNVIVVGCGRVGSRLAGMLSDNGANVCVVDIKADAFSNLANLMTTEVASRLYNVPHVIARLYNSDHERAYMQLGIDYVCGTTLVAEEVFSKALSGHGSHLDTFGDYEVLRFSLDLSWRNNEPIHANEIERSHDIRIIAFERKDGSASSIPSGESTLHHGDLVLACVRRDLIDEFSKFIQA